MYALSNPAYPGLFKIGRSKVGPIKRSQQLYLGKSGVPMRFLVEFAHQVTHRKAAEDETHARLRPYKLNGRREFFFAPLKVVIAAIRDVCADINAGDGFLAVQGASAAG